MKRWIFFTALTASLLWADRIAHIDVEGMTCPLCTVAIKKSLKKTPGVLHAKVRLNSHSATVRFRDDLNASKLLEAIEKVGYKGKILKIEKAE
ncbi:heavy metal-associated domain-containing protein [Hydrogenimonas sp. SS33]|uniref:heavy-metal-associated domain-containing protein n=1 Tax=Hydrogenimonas leucolamina TaxID=2954236 RepID=UPI00336C1658